MMKIPLVDLKQQYEAIKTEVMLAIQKILRNGQSVRGEEVYLFEREFAFFVETEYCVGAGNSAYVLDFMHQDKFTSLSYKRQLLQFVHSIYVGECKV